MDGSRDSTAFDVNVISEGMAVDEEKEEERQEWADYWKQRRELHDKMLLRCPNDHPVHEYQRGLEQMETYYSYRDGELRTAIRWLLVYIISLLILNQFGCSSLLELIFG